jgi:ABC-2 type transport system permease protein
VRTETVTLRARPHQRIALASTFTKSVMDRLPLTLVVGSFLGLMGLVLGPMFASVKDTLVDFMDLMPPELVAMVGGVDMTTPEGWISGEMFSIMAPAAVIYVAIASGARAFAGEMEARSVGLLVANPVSRRRIAVDKAVAMLVHVGLASLLMAVGIWVGILIGDLPIPAANLVATTLHMALLCAASGGLAMLIAVVTGRRMLGLLLAAGAAFVAYLMSWLVPLVGSLEPLAGLSPWYHFNGSDPLANGADWPSLLILAVLTLLTLGASIVAFERRDLPG